MGSKPHAGQNDGLLLSNFCREYGVKEARVGSNNDKVCDLGHAKVEVETNFSCDSARKMTSNHWPLHALCGIDFFHSF